MPEALKPSSVRRICDPAMFDFKTTVEIDPLPAIVGQDRALQALQFGLDMLQPGFNIFVSGAPGTGKAHAVQRYLHDRAESQPVPNDWCYVNNFQDSYRPKALSLPPGRGTELARSMEQLVRRAREELTKAFESDDYTARREEISKAVQATQSEQLEELNQKAQPLGFTVRVTQVGITVVPTRQGKPLTEHDFLNLPPQEQSQLEETRQQLEHGVQNLLKKVREVQRSAEARLETLNREVTQHVVSGLFESPLAQFNDCPDVITYLGDAQEDMINRVRQFLQNPESTTPTAAALLQETALRRYAVNVLVDNSQTKGAPEVIENNPSFTNLVGRLEREALFGVLQTDFTLIKAGALHRANGGYLVLNSADLLRNTGSYEVLKRTLRDRCLVIEDLNDRLGFTSTKSLQPGPIPLNVKVVLLGSPMLYHSLYAVDEEFREVFKVRADFDNRMDRDVKNTQAYAEFACAQCQREGLRPLEAAAVAKLVELGSRLAEDQEKLSTRFSEIADVLREASHWAVQTDSLTVTPAHVRRAIESRTYRSNLIEEHLRELIVRRTIRVETQGAQAGQVNGLAVLMLGDYAFGKPSRISATVGLGQDGVVDIEREAKLGGATHTKGVLILEGFLANRFATDKPLNLSARIVFEQSYDGVDGDSASSTELYAILSALSGVPIKQGIAVTGSVDQLGNVQAIGGINHKVEGFFDVCRIIGLTGEQGVLIPRTNVANLMLREDVVEAVAGGQFHIWAVDTIDEGIEVLTGVAAGERGKNGRFPPKTINSLVDARLRDLARQRKEWGGPNGRKAAKTSP
ncbi:MAG: ATP-binding protein [Dehalococcoidia bacterium]|nr:ATP-binding protein [Dehalococcoidia bacterium]